MSKTTDINLWGIHAGSLVKMGSGFYIYPDHKRSAHQICHPG
jgi:hypothetical protein